MSQAREESDFEACLWRPGAKPASGRTRQRSGRLDTRAPKLIGVRKPISRRR